MRGPIDYIIVGFDGHKFDGSILSALTDALDRGVIKLVALSLIYKDIGGDVTTIDLAESSNNYVLDFVERYNPHSSVIETDDIAEMSELLDRDTAAGMLVVEHLWAKPLKQAILRAGGKLVAEGRIHPEAEAELSK